MNRGNSIQLRTRWRPGPVRKIRGIQGGKKTSFMSIRILRIVLVPFFSIHPRNSNWDVRRLCWEIRNLSIKMIMWKSGAYRKKSKTYSLSLT
jgi:hypothetical protein